MIRSVTANKVFQVVAAEDNCCAFLPPFIDQVSKVFVDMEKKEKWLAHQ